MRALFLCSTLVTVAVLGACGGHPPTAPVAPEGPCTLYKDIPVAGGGFIRASRYYPVCPPADSIRVYGLTRMP